MNSGTAIFNTAIALPSLSVMAGETSPNIEECIDVYLHAWDIFGARPFDSKRLVEQFVERDVGYVTCEEGFEAYLDVLVDQGLLERTDGQYRVRRTPEEDLSAWREHICSPEAIYHLVQQAKRQRESRSGDDAPAVLEHEGETFVSVPADKDTTLSALVAMVADRLDQPPAYNGIVLRSPAAHVGHVQQLAEGLDDADVMADSDLPFNFEIVISSIRGEHKDDLEYRLYLRANR